MTNDQEPPGGNPPSDGSFRPSAAPRRHSRLWCRAQRPVAGRRPPASCGRAWRPQRLGDRRCDGGGDRSDRGRHPAGVQQRLQENHHRYQPIDQHWPYDDGAADDHGTNHDRDRANQDRNCANHDRDRADQDRGRANQDDNGHHARSDESGDGDRHVSQTFNRYNHPEPDAIGPLDGSLAGGPPRGPYCRRSPSSIRRCRGALMARVAGMLARASSRALDDGSRPRTEDDRIRPGRAHGPDGWRRVSWEALVVRQIQSPDLQAPDPQSTGSCARGLVIDGRTNSAATHARGRRLVRDGGFLG